MKTDQLIDMLANGAQAVDPHVLRRRYAQALGAGALVTTVMMIVLLGLQPDLGRVAWLPMFWIKLAFPALILAGASLATARLSRPGSRIGHVPAVIAAPVLALWLLSGAALLNAAPGEQHALLFGSSWLACPASVAALSVPMFVALLWAMKGLAPTRPALAGAAAGLLAGAGAALVYALHCTETSLVFVGVWYVLGMFIPAVLGALIGRIALRW